MLFVKLIRYVKGYIKFSIIGGFAERFINLCGRNGIPLWDFESKADRVTAHTTVKSYSKMRPYVKKTGVRLRIEEKHGLPFMSNRYRKRGGILAGIGFCIVFIAIMSSFIWNVEITGNELVDTEVISEVLRENGIKSGALKRNLDTRQLERKILLEINELSWVAINIKGSTANVNVKERTAPPEKIDLENIPTNIIASDSGQIKYLEVYDGQPMVKVGDTVAKGDIIVSGITEDKKGNNMLKHARAKVIAYVPIELCGEAKMIDTIKIPTGKTKKQFEINAFGIEINLPMMDKTNTLYDTTQTTKGVSIFGKDMPMAITTKTHSFYTEEEITLTLEQAKEKAMLSILLQENDVLSGGTVVEKKATGTQIDDKFVINAQYIIEKDIAKSENILLNN